jgi:PAS domain S-box-containing protein
MRRSDGVYRRIAVHSRSMQLAGRALVCDRARHGRDRAARGRGSAAPGHAATRTDSGVGGRRHLGIDLDGRLTFINEAGARALGYTPEQLTGRDLHELIHHSHADGTPYSRSTSPILQALRRCGADPHAGRGLLAQGRQRDPGGVQRQSADGRGQISGMVVAFQDVSERRRLERMKDEFISTVSHELRTPLTSLRASLGLIQSGALDKRPEKQRQMVEMAIGNCDRLTRLVNDILDFDGAENGGCRCTASRWKRSTCCGARPTWRTARRHRRAWSSASTPRRRRCLPTRNGDAGAERTGDQRDQVLAAGHGDPVVARDTAGADRPGLLARKRCAFIVLRTRDGALRRKSWSASSSASSRAMRRTRGRWAGRAWAWRFAAASWSSTAGASGRKARASWAREAGSCLRCRRANVIGN